MKPAPKLRQYRVGTFYDPTGSQPIRAYTRDYHPDWSGCVEYDIQAESGAAAKRQAILERRQAEYADKSSMKAPVRCVTVQQPWAWLLALQIKMAETRSRDLGWCPGEWVAIHAGAAWPRGLTTEHEVREFCFDLCGVMPDKLERGSIVAVGYVGGVFRMRRAGGFELLRGHRPAWETHEDRTFEERMGDWSPGRYVTLFDRVLYLERPVPLRGRLGLWRLDEADRARIGGEG